MRLASPQSVTKGLARAIASLSVLAASFAQADSNSALRESVISNLNFMKSVYRAEYAPGSWKSRYAAWNLDDEIARAIAKAQTAPNLTLHDSQQILRSFVYSMKDYHVSIRFFSTEEASLPFTVKGTQDKLFISYIDRAKLSEDAFPFSVGGELVSFDGKPAIQALAELQAQTPANVEGTDRALAELDLTSRKWSRGIQVPKGPISVAIRPNASSQVLTRQLIWDYTPEMILDNGSAPVDHLNEPGLGFGLNAAPSPFRLLKPQMSVDFANVAEDNPHGLGARKSFIPALGAKVFESSPDEPFYAYLYKTADRKLIGYIRIPSYVPADTAKAVAHFSKLIATFEATTDALVIDQVNNPGGSVFYLYTLASMLSDHPLTTPQHRMSIVQSDVVEALSELKKMEAIRDEESAKKTLGPTLDGYPVSYEVAQFTLNYLRFIVREWSAGHTLTQPYWIAGVDRINPSPVHYTKPILLLTNNLDFSGGDFFPAIMQDNKRVTILGTRTAGAGGYVNDVNYPNNLGVDRFRVTQSLARRVDENPIENLGVKPEIEYQISEKDLKGDYSEYTQAIQSAVSALTK